MKTATFILRREDFRGDARLFRLEPPLAGTTWDDESFSHEFVVVSAADVLGTPETYIFAADESGEVTSCAELEGSQKGTLSHSEVLADIGYVITGDMSELEFKHAKPLKGLEAAFVGTADAIGDVIGYQPGQGIKAT